MTADDTNDMNPVDPATIPVWRWQAAGIALAATIAAAILLPSSASVGLSFASPLALAVAVPVAFVLAWTWPPLAYRHLRYGLDDTGIWIQRGVVWRSHVLLPRIRIQHSDVAQSPLQRRYGIATLKLYTAGSRYTEIVLPGLAQSDAAALRDALLARAAGDGV